MKSRLAMMAMLVSGLLLSGTGATLAVSGTAPSTSASAEQYPATIVPPVTPETVPPPTVQVLPEQTTGDVAPESPSTPAEKKDDAPVAEKGAAPAAQPVEQVEAGSDDTLPFTGFAAIPILVGGIALMGGGLVMRRRTAA